MLKSELLLTLTGVIEDIKKIISKASYRETVGEPTLTLMQIYATIEEAEKKIGKQELDNDTNKTDKQEVL